MKKRYVLAALAAMTVFAGCGDNASQQKNTDNTTQESTAEEDQTAADPDEEEKNWILNFPRCRE